MFGANNSSSLPYGVNADGVALRVQNRCELGPWHVTKRAGSILVDQRFGGFSVRF